MTTKVEFLHADQIGGCVTLISTETTKICIDFGANLEGSKYKEDLEIVGLTYGKADYDAVFFTHYHGDHIGRFDKLLPTIPLYMSSLCRDATLNVYQALVRHDASYQKQIDVLEDETHTHIIWAEQVIEIGDIKVVPYMIDHSATAAMMFVIETPDKRILHMGDFRTHGYIGEKWELLLRNYVLKKPVDILITEGTNLARTGFYVSEAEVAAQAETLVKKHKLLFCLCASTNFIRLSGFYRAAYRAHKPTLANGYMIKQFESYYQYKQELFERLRNVKLDFQLAPDRIYRLLVDREELCYKKAYQIQEQTLQKRGAVIWVCGANAVSTLKKLFEKYKALNPLLIYSLWSGYIENKGAEYYDADLAELCNNYSTVQLHTSGHASKESVEWLIKFVNALDYTAIIHSERAEIRRAK